MKRINKIYGDIAEIERIEKVQIEVKGEGNLNDFTHALCLALPDFIGVSTVLINYAVVYNRQTFHQHHLLYSTRLGQKIKQDPIQPLNGKYTVYIPFFKPQVK